MLEIKRQAIHLLFGVILLFIALQLNELAFLLLSLALLVSAIIVSFLLRKTEKHFLVYIIKQVERIEEKHFLGYGAILFFFGFFIVAFFNFIFALKELVAFSLMPLIVGDAFSTLFGTYFGKTKIAKNKSLEGTLAFIVSTFAVLFILYPEKLVLAITSAVCGALIELLPFDDNLSIPACLTLILVAVREFI